MRRRPLESLGALVRAKRGEETLRVVAARIGIGPATLLRVESGRVPDVSTFGKLCLWLGRDPREFLGSPSGRTPGALGEPQVGQVQVTAHFRADATPQAETMAALAKMLLLSARLQPPRPDADA
jgi:transcriptional regulator with XRE-family HTH domain